MQRVIIMININKHTKLKHQTLLAESYKQTKQLEKAMGVALQNLSQKYQSAIELSRRLTESVITSIKSNEARIIQNLQRQKDQIVSKIDQQWNAFKKYAINVRRAFLGEDQSSTIQTYTIDKIQSLVDQISRKLQYFDELTQDYEKTCFQMSDIVWQPNKQAQSQTSKSQRNNNVVIQNEISPIKNKQKRNNTENAKIDNSFSQKMAVLANTVTQNNQLKNDLSPASQIQAKNQFHNGDQFKKINIRNQHKISYPQSQTKIQKSFKIISLSNKIQINTNRTTVCKLKPVHQHQINLETSLSNNNEGLRSIKSMDNLRSLRQSISNNKLLQFESSVNSSSKRINYVKSPQKEQLAIRKNYNGCLEMLQNQKLQYEKIKRRFK